MTQNTLRVNGTEIRRRRLTLGLSLTQLAAKVALRTDTVAKPRSAIASYEAGTYAPSSPMLAGLALALDCTMEELITTTD